MSRSSTHSDAKNIFIKSSNKLLTRSSKEKYKYGQEQRKQPLEDWPESKVNDDLSSFIAEFSYLNDDLNISQTKKPVVQSQTYHVNTVIKYDAGPFKHGADKGKDLNSRKKSMQYRAYQDSLVIHRKKNKNSPVSGEELYRDAYRGNSQKKLFRNRSKSSSSSKKRRKKSRSMLRMRRKVSLSRHRRASRSGSQVRYMPFYVNRKRSKPKAKIRKEEPRREVIRKVNTQEPPTIITLYPKNKSRMKFKQDFLTDTTLTCKCFDCMKKYESLIRLLPPRIPPPYTPKMPTQLKFTPCPSMYHNHPCTLHPPYCSPYNSCHGFGNGYKSVLMKFNCIGQCLDSTITQYFHSILNRPIYY